jgi:mRNA interferase RelE/StbE
MAHSIEFKPSADKELEALSGPLQVRVLKAVNKLADNPRPHGCKKLTGRDEYRIRVGNYRVVYEIHDTVLVVLVVRIAPRGKAYRK